MTDQSSRIRIDNAQAEKDRFMIRSRARTHEVQRRNMMNETVDYHTEVQKVYDDLAEAEYTKDSRKKLKRAETTIVELLRNSAAFQKTIDRLTDAWGEDKEKAMESAQAILDEATKELENDGTFVAKSKVWAGRRLDPDNNRPVAKPVVGPRKPKP